MSHSVTHGDDTYYPTIYFRNGLYQTAYSALLNIDQASNVDVLVEKSNWFLSQKNLHEALLSLEDPTVKASSQENSLLSAKV